MENYIKKPLHVGISVKNMEESIQWYSKNLGFKAGETVYVPPLKSKICFMEKEDFALELFEYDKPIDIPQERLTPNSDLQTIGTKHVAFLTDNMKKLKERFVDNGVDIAHEVEMEGQAVMFIRDNNGVLIEFIEK